MNLLPLRQRQSFKSLLRFLFVVPIFLTSPGLLQAMVIDFDDLTVASGLFVPQGYQGFSWLGGNGTGSWVNNASASIDGAGAHSGSNYAWSNGGTQVDLENGLFDVSSLWARNRVNVATTNRTFEGWLGATKLFTVSQQVTNSWSQVSLNFSGIDRFTITSGANILIDDIGVNKVPEPATMLLLGLGLAGLGFARRRSLSASRAP